MKITKIELQKRIKTINFWIRIATSGIIPIATIMALEPSAITSWGVLFENIQAVFLSPFLLGVLIFSLWQSFQKTINDVEEKND